MRLEGVDNTLMERLLPAPLIIDGFVAGDKRCNHEYYLVELLNASPYFLNKLCNGKYKHQDEQNDAESDCYGDGYEIDFKRIESEKMLRARSIFSRGMVQIAPGCVITTRPKVTTKDKNYSPIDAPYLHKALRGYSKSQLEEIWDKSGNITELEKTVKDCLKILRVRKHLLLFIPYLFYFDNKTNDYSLEEGINQIIMLLNNDYGSALEYRREEIAYDTYFTFLFKNHFVIVESTNNGLKCVDYVDKRNVQTFCYLEKYAPDNWNPDEKL